MKLRYLFSAVVAGTILLAAPAVNAATFATGDGVLSIETPNDSWIQTSDPNYWFVISDGKNSITIDHLSNGESLPNITTADNNYPEVFQGYVSTLDEVFVVKALASEVGNLESLMKAIGTIKVLKSGTKTAIAAAPAAQASEFGMRQIGATYYVNTNELNVRSSCSTDSARLGSLFLGEAVTVNGAVTKNGADYGWYQIQYNGNIAYVSAGFLSTEKPATGAAQAQTSNEQAQNTSKPAATNNNNPAIGSPFTVTDAKGYDVATLTLHSDGLYYDENGAAYRDNGDSSYSNVNTGVYVFGEDYIEKLNESIGLVPSGGPIPVTDAKGYGMGSLIPYSDGLFYDSTMEGYVSNGNGSYTGTLTGAMLYEYDYLDRLDDYDDDDDYEYDDDEAIIIHDGYGGALEIYPAYDGSGFYVDEFGNYYMPGNDGDWHTSTGDDDFVYWEED